MSKLTLEDVIVKGKRVLLRVDFNVPIENGCVLNDKRLRAAIPTILYLLKRGSKLVLISHLGRPSDEQNKELSLKPCAEILSQLIGKKVSFLDRCVGDEVENFVNQLANGQVVLLENLRFNDQEVKNGREFSKQLSKLADLYVNDAFGTIHRAHASTEGVTHFIDLCVMGFLVSKELNYIGNALKHPVRMFVAVLGGSKISDKLSTINNLLPKVDLLILGGGMVYTFLKAKGIEIGESLFEPDKIQFAAKLLRNFEDKLVLPVDCVVTNSFTPKNRNVGNTKCIDINSIKQGWYGIDIGVRTSLKFANILRFAKTIIWNGPLGVFEIEAAASGTFSVAKAIGEATHNGAVTIVGGGDSILAVERSGVIDRISHVSTGGGASLKFIGGEVLPGVVALTDRFC